MPGLNVLCSKVKMPQTRRVVEHARSTLSKVGLHVRHMREVTARPQKRRTNQDLFIASAVPIHVETLRPRSSCNNVVLRERRVHSPLQVERTTGVKRQLFKRILGDIDESNDDIYDDELERRTSFNTQTRNNVGEPSETRTTALDCPLT